MSLKQCYKNLKWLPIVLVSTIHLSMTPIDHYDILSSDDLHLEIEESKSRPALSAAINEVPYWQSFNTWTCFPTDNVKPYCAEIDYGKLLLPTLQITGSDENLYDFSLDPEPNLNCEETLTRWLNILDRQRSFCVYAAFLQKLSGEHELWIVDTLKTYSGHWTARTDTDDIGPNTFPTE